MAINNLKYYRIKKNLMTQGELAALADVSQVTISFIENDKCKPMDLTKEKLSRALNVPVEDIFPEDADE